MQCADHPLVYQKNGINLNFKSGIHLHYPDLACDRRKLIEIRREAIGICNFFPDAVNDAESIFDEAVYKAVFMLFIFFL